MLELTNMMDLVGKRDSLSPASSLMRTGNVVISGKSQRQRCLGGMFFIKIVDDAIMVFFSNRILRRLLQSRVIYVVKVAGFS